MAKIMFDTIKANYGHKFSWSMVFQDSSGDAFDLTGCVLTAQIRSNAQPSTPLVTPTITIPDPTNGTALFSVTGLQCEALTSPGFDFGDVSKFPVEIDLAFSDDPTDPAQAYGSIVEVSPGGN